MRKYIHFLGLLLLPFFLIVITEYIINYINLYQKYNITIGVLSTFLMLLVIIVIFRKNISKKQFYTHLNIKKTLLFAVIFTIFLYIIGMSIEYLYTNNYALQSKTYQLDMIIYVVLFAPILEELVCRIIIINRFFTKIPVWLLITGTSLLFALLHIKNINLVISTFLFGAILGYFFIRTKNALLLILIHFFYNFFFIVIHSYFYKINQLFIFTSKYPLWTIVTIVIVLILIFGVFRKYFDKWLLMTKKINELKK